MFVNKLDLLKGWPGPYRNFIKTVISAAWYYIFFCPPVYFLKPESYFQPCFPVEAAFAIVVVITVTKGGRHLFKNLKDKTILRKERNEFFKFDFDWSTWRIKKTAATTTITKDSKGKKESASEISHVYPILEQLSIQLTVISSFKAISHLNPPAKKSKKVAFNPWNLFEFCGGHFKFSNTQSMFGHASTSWAIGNFRKIPSVSDWNISYESFSSVFGFQTSHKLTTKNGRHKTDLK